MDLSQAGVGDAVLLENFESEKEFIDNLKVRFEDDIVYTYIGNVCVSVNPYKSVPIYSNEILDGYRGKELFENKPHVFAVADGAYRDMIEENKDHCVLISGESGAGKTEASKKILQYIAAVSAHTKEVEVVRDRLLESNPVLEAFGNAKTVRNDNSSRFGKYMDIQFDYRGAPIGGHIINYLLEKSRVVHQSDGERNFHIFYQLLLGADDDLLEKLKLERNISKYNYLSVSAGQSFKGIDDVEDYKIVMHALTTLGFAKTETISLFKVISGILHLGNLEYEKDEQDHAKVKNIDNLQIVAEVLEVNFDELNEAMTHRSIVTNGQRTTSPLNLEQGYYARDALAKSLYERMFTWLVSRLNDSLSFHKGEYHGRRQLLGVLDIYGFEVFEQNSFEQMCINYCNEKLQQLFIQLTLRSEQEEYNKEGIEWTPIEYFDNQIICMLIEQKHKGIISCLEEECTMPGNRTDETFLEKLNNVIGQHNHFSTRKLDGKKTKSELEENQFLIKHYAGDVTYNIAGFMDKSSDLLYRDMKETCSRSTNELLDDMFPPEELESKKRPPTAGIQFKNSLNNLVNILESKEPSYIRCIKPNANKSSTQFEMELVKHQVRYLGLMENLRVRRAGFAFRRVYSKFLTRFKIVAPETWPNWAGEEKEGVAKILEAINVNIDGEVRFGKTKVFVKSPKTLYDLEIAYHKHVERITIMLQSKLRGFVYRVRFLKQRKAQILIGKYYKMHKEKNSLTAKKEGVKALRQLIRGYNCRNEEPNDDNEFILSFARQAFLRKIQTLITEKKEITNCTEWMHDSEVPTSMKQASECFRKIHAAQTAKKYFEKYTETDHEMMRLKVLASNIFKGKKKGYEDSIPKLFEKERDVQNHSKYASFYTDNTQYGDSITKYGILVSKINRKDKKTIDRYLLVTDKSLFIIDGKKFTVVHRHLLSAISMVSVTSEDDGIMVLRTDEGKGDYILHVANHLIECCTLIADALGGGDKVEITTGLKHHYKSKEVEIDTASLHRQCSLKQKN